ncbi:MAG: RelA/SpoT domain-containing protein [Armatimonadota bacterium]|nr:RelA/SpoT domain-containing protein [bacterium]
MPLDEKIISESIERYGREMDRYSKLADIVADKCRQILEDKGIRGAVQWREKTPSSLRDKLRNYLVKADKCGLLNSVDDIFTFVGDLAGVRVTTYVESDRPMVVNAIKEAFDGATGNWDKDIDNKDRPENLYRATHCQVVLKDDVMVGRYTNLKGLSCEIQVCSMLAHVYNEIEHDLRYKPTSGELTDDENGVLDALGHLAVSGDTLVQQAINASEKRKRENTSQFEDVYDFIARMKRSFPTATDFAVNAKQLYDVCIELGLDSPEKIEKEVMKDKNYQAHAEELVAALSQYVSYCISGMLLINPVSSDQLLVLLLEKFAERLRDLYPSGRGIGRALRIVSVAKRYQDMRQQEIQES